ncbi:uncharacterized protein L969DRAFT_45514 [Mixia osmundae IAM 14324]|uniref:Uncharacterized protein n=1 Tax=Mixia osmundae (strain CBS 9802 / IAM 14324 / JCM 22182 / KY 12970) TaxID=764103 RepID=G7DYW2_MIXOS|nr:uncharacterized protein L969DRAFT_45514 [Mixia osmundae IAM 14324]KEI41668.1 hypothetical protein L969DRAFT_45514 [Mixia osmundae IAM 14324]GAA95772.1 hypothetical protein E5Q_02429 [Mixia osmundae IAM 14324]
MMVLISKTLAYGDAAQAAEIRRMQLAVVAQQIREIQRDSLINTGAARRQSNLASLANLTQRANRFLQDATSELVLDMQAARQDNATTTDSARRDFDYRTLDSDQAELDKIAQDVRDFNANAGVTFDTSVAPAFLTLPQASGITAVGTGAAAQPAYSVPSQPLASPANQSQPILPSAQPVPAASPQPAQPPAEAPQTIPELQPVQVIPAAPTVQPAQTVKPAEIQQSAPIPPIAPNLPPSKSTAQPFVALGTTALVQAQAIAAIQGQQDAQEATTRGQGNTGAQGVAQALRDAAARLALAEAQRSEAAREVAELGREEVLKELQLASIRQGRGISSSSGGARRFAGQSRRCGPSRMTALPSTWGTSTQ